VRSSLGAMAPEVDRRICDALREAAARGDAGLTKSLTPHALRH
jgi:hypothetical protein